MRIGILTFHAAYNYGSMLQAFALQTVVQNLGHDVEIIDFRPYSQKLMYRTPFSILKPRPLLSDIKRILLSHGKEFRKFAAKRRFEEFAYSFLNLSKIHTNPASVKSVCTNYDVIILGSDQIWNQSAMDHCDIYFGHGLSTQKGLISYAASMGPDPASLSPYINKVDFNILAAISVREESASKYLSRITTRDDIVVALDPTLLLKADQYHPLFNNKFPQLNKREEYIYYYTPGTHPDLLEIARKIAKILNLPLKQDMGYFPERANNMHYPLGPSEFLKEIAEAQWVIGTSFHLIVFAILLHKEFICINGDKDARMNDLLHKLELSDRIITEESLSSNTLPLFNKINWDLIDKQLKLLREKSIGFLTESLNKFDIH
ncbi:MAG: polysaccharide pyruvyl transferase family protein [Muribaculaceae bacterium]|nr:polysaccharide pyruvyl transferase family protein [Muribaculaceae bacterium]